VKFVFDTGPFDLHGETEVAVPEAEKD